ncbi:hypothetical protein P153DRAFT_148928 [Dothidotthia symphoricarpi CBS 119687]|uniref:Uncharacterized protein n=1 Tax=Dothidotthia symphoricarpi CBS 119687 TaxID=1392245 RepID=A0A6A5ZYT9_9PLEO|nr:uncharacterized protein P153DRAFT_148928 [Dothidotthia symphoricarpi CBS 119687]KAF2123568.1 hypothetical protein P153DRAFT_148928 [Dothidotthia symphoricarpi CBS 119687]
MLSELVPSSMFGCIPAFEEIHSAFAYPRSSFYIPTWSLEFPTPFWDRFESTACDIERSSTTVLLKDLINLFATPELVHDISINGRRPLCYKCRLDLMIEIHGGTQVIIGVARTALECRITTTQTYRIKCMHSRVGLGYSSKCSRNRRGGDRYQGSSIHQLCS